MLFEPFLPFELSAFDWIAGWAAPFWDRFFVIVTTLGDGGILWIALGLLLFFARKSRKTGAAILIAMLLMLLINNFALKNMFARPRPFALELDWWVEAYVWPGLVKFPGEYAFPSGHTAGSFAGAMAWCFASKKAWLGDRARLYSVIGIVLAACIGFSRIYIGVHYVTDVIAGMLSGTVCALLAMVIMLPVGPLLDKIKPRSSHKNAGQPVNIE